MKCSVCGAQIKIMAFMNMGICCNDCLKAREKVPERCLAA